VRPLAGGDQQDVQVERHGLACLPSRHISGEHGRSLPIVGLCFGDGHERVLSKRVISDIKSRFGRMS
jgi:hypothetical protein